MHGSRHIQHRRGTRGFTLVELLSSLFVIGLILGILIVGLRFFFAAGQATKQRAAVTQMKQAVADFRAKFGYLPPLVRDQYVHPTQPSGMPNLGRDSVEAIGSTGISRFAITDDSYIARWVPAVVANNEYQDPRFSVRTLPYYLMGALDVDVTGAAGVVLPIDGVVGPGSHRPNADGSFAIPGEVLRSYIQNPGHPLRKFTAETYLPFIDSGSTDPKLSKVADSFYDAPSDTAPMQLTLRDGKNVVYRYYRWSAKDPLSNNPPVVNQNIPLMVGSASDAAVRGSTYAIVGAGPNLVFGDEDVNLLRGRLGKPLNYPEASARKDAAADNIVEVGQ